MDVLIAGCSFSDREKYKGKNGETYDGIDIWPELVCNHFGWDLKKNLSEAGGSNELIIDRLTVELVSNGDDYDIVILGLTQWERTWIPGLNLYVNLANPPEYRLWIPGENHKVKSGEDPEINYFREFDYKDIQFRNVIESNISKILQFKAICNSMDKKLIVVQIAEPLNSGYTERVISHKLFEELQFIIGFPFLPRLYGCTGVETLIKNWKELTVDNHPNAEGHKVIAEWVIKNL